MNRELLSHRACFYLYYSDDRKNVRNTMKSQTHQSSGERCAFFQKKIGVYLRRLIVARIIRCTDHFIGADRRSRWAV